VKLDFAPKGLVFDLSAPLSEALSEGPLEGQPEA
jgi:hypothetical protein